MNSKDDITKLATNSYEDITELVLADVHQLLSGEEAGGGGTPHVRLLLAAGSEGLEGGVVDELGLLHHLQQSTNLSSVLSVLHEFPIWPALHCSAEWQR